MFPEYSYQCVRDIFFKKWAAYHLYWPTCLLCCLVLRRTICRMLELVMSDTTSDTRFQTRNRAPHNMWYWRRRMPCRHSWPSSIFLHFPFLRKGQRRKSHIFHAYNKRAHKFLANPSFRKTVQQVQGVLRDLLHPSILNTVHWSPGDEGTCETCRLFLHDCSQVICKSLGMASDLKTTLTES